MCRGGLGIHGSAKAPGFSSLNKLQDMVLLAGNALRRPCAELEEGFLCFS